MNPAATYEEYGSLKRGLETLVPTRIGELTPSTLLREVAPAGMARAALFHALVRFGGGQPPELVGSMTTAGDAVDWLRVQWQGPLPDDLVEATRDLHQPSRIQLRPVMPADYDVIYLASVHPERGFRWRFKGETPSPDDVIGSLWRGVHAQFIVAGADDERPIGLVVCYQASPENGTAYIGFQRLAWDRPAGGETFEGMVHFIEFLFRNRPFRKLYAEVPGYNATGVWGGTPTIFKQEGCLAANEFHHQKWWDLQILTLDRVRWARWLEPWRTWAGLPMGVPPPELWPLS